MKITVGHQTISGHLACLPEKISLHQDISSQQKNKYDKKNEIQECSHRNSRIQFSNLMILSCGWSNSFTLKVAVRPKFESVCSKITLFRRVVLANLYSYFHLCSVSHITRYYHVHACKLIGRYEYNYNFMILKQLLMKNMKNSRDVRYN